MGQQTSPREVTSWEDKRKVPQAAGVATAKALRLDLVKEAKGGPGS